MRYWGKGWAIAVSMAAVTAGSFPRPATRSAAQAPAASPGRLGPHCRQTRLQRDLGGQQHRQLGPSDARSAPHGWPTRPDPRTPSFSQRRCSRLAPIGWVPRGPRRRGGRRDSLPAVGGGEKEGEPGTLDRPRPGNQVLPAGHTARACICRTRFRLSRVRTNVMMVFEFANAQRTIHLTKMDPYPNVAYMGYSVGPLGRRHAGGRRYGFHRCDMVRQGREFP